MNDSQDDRITQVRKQLYQNDKSNFDDICFTLFICPFCGKEKINSTLLPIIDKGSVDINTLKFTQESTLARIFDADFDFLHEKSYCGCKQDNLIEVKRIIYCYNQKDIDYHNYIDYPFESVQTYKVNLVNKTKKLLFFDTETTGIPKNWKASYLDTNNWPRLVQIAWIVSDEFGNVITRNSFIIRPDNFIISKEASDIHRITTETAIRNGEDIRAVLELFNEAISQSEYIIAHNIDYDINIVACELFRLNVDSDIFEKQQICTMKQTTNYCAISGPYGYNWPKLSDLHYKLFNSSFSEAHDASVDIDITFKCFSELIKKQIIKLH
jgi:DNA polymerase-3 subunit epsilon